ncbi:MAG: tetratricopeptide repeat protein [Bacteroidota bacterium]
MSRLWMVLIGIAVMFSLAVGQGAADQSENEARKLFNEGNALFKRGNYTGAIEKCKAALAIAQDYRYQYLLGLSYKNSKQYADAVTALKASIALNGGFAGAHNAVGGLYLTQAQYDAAIEAFKTALKADPKLKPALKGISEAYAGKGQQLMDQGKYENAGELIDEALLQHSDNPKLYLLAARIYNRLERPEKAIEAANEALKQKKGRSKGAEYFEMGMAYKKMNDFAKARTAFSEAGKDASYSRNAQYELEGLRGK